LSFSVIDLGEEIVGLHDAWFREESVEILRGDLRGGGGEMDQIIHYRFLAAQDGRLPKFI
jgi:hypothetical protein